MNIRNLSPTDAVHYRKLRLQALHEWPPAFGSPANEEEKKSVEEMANFLKETGDRKLFGAFVDSALVGMVRHSRYSGSNEGHRSYVASFYVDPGFRGHGTGRALLTAAINDAENDEVIQRINLTVVSSQAPAIQLYESVGFSKCGTDYEAFSARDEFFDELLMTKRLHAGPKRRSTT